MKTRLCAFYFFRDGDALIDWIRSDLPVAPERLELELLGRRFDKVVIKAVYGNTTIVLMEGVIGGLAFWLVGLPSAILRGLP